MFETKFANSLLWREQGTAKAPGPSRLSRESVQHVLFLFWEEHCVECAVPECYKLCPLYVRRKDGNCSRFTYGIWPNKEFKGHHDFGADIQFRRWGKIGGRAGPDVTACLSRFREDAVSRLQGDLRTAVTNATEKLGNRKLDFDEFVVECFSPGREKFNLVLEYYINVERHVRKTVFRHSFSIEPGTNFFTIPFSEFNLGEKAGHILLYPDSEQPKRLIFTWLDFVKYKEGSAIRRSEHEAPAAKIKCVAWDLDNTLWKGVLAETADPAELHARPESLELIRQLDERGIIQTVVSKNTHEEAWRVIDRLGLSDIFVYPAINWGSKSQNLQQVAEKINIGLDTFAFIDDSPFERAEVQSALPQVRVFADTEIGGLTRKSEFDVPVTDAGKVRRQSYLANMKRDEFQAVYTGSYDEFLASCEMKMRIFEPRSGSGAPALLGAHPTQQSVEYLQSPVPFLRSSSKF